MINRKSALVVTSSEAFARAIPEQVTFEQTYVSLLRKEYPQIDFHHIGHGGETIGYMRTYIDRHYPDAKFDIVIIVLGIVDCAPRTFTLREKKVLNILPRKVASLVRKMAKWFKVRDLRNIALTSKDNFKKDLDHLLTKGKEKITLSLISPIPEYEQMLPRITERTVQYGEIIEKSDSKTISIADLVKEDLMSDLHHYNVQGHRKVFDKISKVLKKMVL